MHNFIKTIDNYKEANEELKSEIEKLKSEKAERN